MRLLSPTEAATLLGTKCGGGSQEDGALSMILDMILPRVEDAMNVATLVRGDFVDTFLLPQYDVQHSPLTLRLSNGYVVDGSIHVIDYDGEDITSDVSFQADLELGTVAIDVWRRGAHRIRYTSGFEPIPDTMPDPNNPQGPPIPKPINELVLKDVPEWIKALAVGFVVEWMRTFQVNPKVNKEISYGQVEAALRRHIYARVYSRYMRPRADVVWSKGMNREP